VTPLKLDMTDEPFLTRLAQLFADEAAGRTDLARGGGADRNA
jgi:hypothetical protein